jgi:hypothetical protein
LSPSNVWIFLACGPAPGIPDSTCGAYYSIQTPRGELSVCKQLFNACVERITQKVAMFFVPADGQGAEGPGGDPGSRRSTAKPRKVRLSVALRETGVIQ